MPCGEKCKIILDGNAAAMAAVNKSVACMNNSIILAAVNDVDIPAELLRDFKSCAEALAKAGQAVAAAIELP